jgi:carboxy-cis,cis-muconate cyclase
VSHSFGTRCAAQTSGTDISLLCARAASLDANPDDYRGDTIRTSPSTPFVFATTRGKTSSTRGYLCAYALDPQTGHLVSPSSKPSAVFQTPTSGGRANAIEVIETRGRGRGDELEWIVLTDEEERLVLVISWNGVEFVEVSRVQLEEGDGASHAVWLE